MKEAKLILYTFIACMVVCLLLVWYPHYFMTGDGPCHLYNAQILHDSWRGGDSFYRQFFHIVYRPDPNWFATFCMASLLFVVKGLAAEKMFLSMYIVLYTAGFFLLVKTISGRSTWWVLTVFIFIFTHALTKGFYNFSFGIAFWLWTVWCWLRFLQGRRVFALLFCLFAALTFFTHLMAFAIAVFACFALAVSAGIASRNGRLTIMRVTLLVLLVSPLLALAGWFSEKEGGMQLSLGFHPYRLVELVQFKHIVNFNHNELLWSTIVGGVLVVLLIASLVSSFQGFAVSRYDGLLWTLACVMIAYLILPEDMLGRAMDMSLRTQVYVQLLIALVISYRLASEKWKTTGAAVTVICFVVLSALRSQAVNAASATEERVMAAGKIVRPGTVLLPLNLAPQGMDKKEIPIADWNFSFRHATQYIGLDKDVVLLDNYEANAGYFPVQWNAKVNPYALLSAGSGIEGNPPFARIADYQRKSGVQINYVLLLWDNVRVHSDPNFSVLYNEVRTLFHEVYRSADGQMILYERNG